MFGKTTAQVEGGVPWNVREHSQGDPFASAQSRFALDCFDKSAPMPAVRRRRPDRQLLEMTAAKHFEDEGKPDRVLSQVVIGHEDEATPLRWLRIRRSRPRADCREHGREQRVSFILDRFKKFQIIGRRLSNNSSPHDSEGNLTNSARKPGQRCHAGYCSMVFSFDQVKLPAQGGILGWSPPSPPSRSRPRVSSGSRLPWVQRSRREPPG